MDETDHLVRTTKLSRNIPSFIESIKLSITNGRQLPQVFQCCNENKVRKVLPSNQGSFYSVGASPHFDISLEWAKSFQHLIENIDTTSQFGFYILITYSSNYGLNLGTSGGTLTPKQIGTLSEEARDELLARIYLRPEERKPSEFITNLEKAFGNANSLESNVKPIHSTPNSILNLKTFVTLLKASCCTNSYPFFPFLRQCCAMQGTEEAVQMYQTFGSH